MHSDGELYELLVKQGLILAGPLVSHPEQESGYIAFVKVKINNEGRKTPGSRALSQIAKLASKSGYSLSIVAVDDSGDDFDTSLKSVLFVNFGDSVRNSFASFVKRGADVWIEPKAQLSPQEKSRIREKVSEFCDLIGFELKGVSFSDSENTPTPTAILKVLRINAPSSVEALRTLLGQRGFTVPNEVWLNHTLDKMRKAGLVVRSKNGDFFLSLRALSGLGTAKSRQSPDILRALDLAKRGA